LAALFLNFENNSQEYLLALAHLKNKALKLNESNVEYFRDSEFKDLLSYLDKIYFRKGGQPLLIGTYLSRYFESKLLCKSKKYSFDASLVILAGGGLSFSERHCLSLFGEKYKAKSIDLALSLGFGAGIFIYPVPINNGPYIQLQRYKIKKIRRQPKTILCRVIIY
jgi:hypothetical protein